MWITDYIYMLDSLHVGYIIGVKYSLVLYVSILAQN